MSSMHIFSKNHRLLPALSLTVSALALPLLATAPASAQDAASWDRARAEMVARAPSSIGQAVSRWETLVAQRDLGFDAYADFILAYPGFPQQDSAATPRRSRFGRRAGRSRRDRRVFRPQPRADECGARALRAGAGDAATPRSRAGRARGMARRQHERPDRAVSRRPVRCTIHTRRPAAADGRGAVGWRQRRRQAPARSARCEHPRRLPVARHVSGR